MFELKIEKATAGTSPRPLPQEELSVPITVGRTYAQVRQVLDGFLKHAQNRSDQAFPMLLFNCG